MNEELEKQKVDELIQKTQNAVFGIFENRMKSVDAFIVVNELLKHCVSIGAVNEAGNWGNAPFEVKPTLKKLSGILRYIAKEINDRPYDELVEDTRKIFALQKGDEKTVRVADLNTLH